MTTFGAYDAGLPCRNPNCKSYGYPHPNCQCYGGLPDAPVSATSMARPRESKPPVAGNPLHPTSGRGAVAAEAPPMTEGHGNGPRPPAEELAGTQKFGWFKRLALRLGFAEGGEVEQPGGVDHYCQTCMAHEPSCEYFADGGDAGAPAGPAGPPPASSFWEDDALPAAGGQPQDSGQPAAPIPAPMPTETGGQPSAAPPVSPAQPAADSFWEKDAKPIASDFWGEDAKPVADEARYGTPDQQVATAFEGAAQGIAGPLATMAETKVLGVDPNDIAGRQLTNPATHSGFEYGTLAAGMAVGVGEAELAVRAGAGAAELFGLGKMGAKVVAGGISNGLIQAGDEVNKWLLGLGDQEAPVASALANVGAMALLGGAGGAVSHGIDVARIGTKADSFALGIGVAAAGDPALSKMAEAGIGSKAAFNYGKKYYSKIMSKMSVPATTAGAIGAYAGYRSGGVQGALEGGAEGFAAGLGLNLLGRGVSRYISPVVAKGIASGVSKDLWTDTLVPALDHASNVGEGASKITKGVDSLFKAGGLGAFNTYDSLKKRDELDSFIEAGGVGQNLDEQMFQNNDTAEPTQYAEGGPVGAEKRQKTITDHSRGLDVLYPEQNMMMNAAKSRISNYLSGLRPQKNTPRLAFDDEPDQREQKKTYDRALDVAINPLGVLSDIGRGTIEPEHIQHLSAMYPEVLNHLQKKITERIIKAQMAGQTPSYKVRQGLSMLMGTALSSEMTPSAIQAVQQTFAETKAKGQDAAPAAPKKSSAPLTKSDSAFLTGSQALQKRQQRAT